MLAVGEELPELVRRDHRPGEEQLEECFGFVGPGDERCTHGVHVLELVHALRRLAVRQVAHRRGRVDAVEPRHHVFDVLRRHALARQVGERHRQPSDLLPLIGGLDERDLGRVALA